jgi:hypothetical protein
MNERVESLRLTAEKNLSGRVSVTGLFGTKLLGIEDRIFTEWRIGFYGLGVVLAYAISLTWRTFNHQWVILANGDWSVIDFGWMWLSGKLAASGEVHRVFDHFAFSAAQRSFFFPSLSTDDVLLFNRFNYPPTFLFLTCLLGLIPYLTACATWIVGSLLLYEAAVYAIVSRPAALIGAATPFFVIINIYLVHTGFLTAAFIGLSLAFAERRPWISGIFLGLLTYKPHFGLLFPIALLASRNWRALSCAAATTVILSVTAGIAFGYVGWASFIEALGDRSSSLGPAVAGELKIFSIFGALDWMRASPMASWSAQSAVSSAMVLSIWLLWAKPFPYNLRAAALCVGSVTVSPYVMYYDLCILTIGVAFLVKDGISRGFLPGERTSILLCWSALFVMQPSVGAIVCLVLIFLCIRRIIAYRTDVRHSYWSSPAEQDGLARADVP